jgi:aspartyl-tRNA(Asn)/glutamyl-tRNA(Gln) amidotransferase subunit A
LKTIRELYTEFRDRSRSPVEFTQELLLKITGHGANLNCFITVLRESALREAEESQRRYEKGEPRGPLDGVPIAVKDLIYIDGVRCTAGSKILSENVASYDSPAAGRLKSAGAVLIGTTNLHEFAAGITGENPHFGPVRNPWDLERISGGSSSGSAAAVAAGLSVGALGTDTAGSVRTPAALCGVVGLKPTYGRISRLGVIPLASSFDTVGTLTACAWDAAALLGVLAGHDAEDLTTVAAEVPDYAAEVALPSAGMKVGVPRQYFHEQLDPGVEDVFTRFLDRLTDAGCALSEVELQGLESVGECWRTIRYAEAAAFHLRWLEKAPRAYGDDVRSSLELGKKIAAVDYVNAQNLRPSLMQGFSASMKEVDLLAVPCTAITAPKIGQKSTEVEGKEVEVRSALIRFTLPFNVVGFPAVSLPAGLSRGLPVGVQLVAGPFEEPKLLRLACALEASAPYPDPLRIV